MKASEIFNYDESETRYYEMIGITDFGYNDDGLVYTKLNVTDAHKNGSSLCHGGAIMSLADIAAAAWTRLCWKRSVTIDSSTQFLVEGRVGTTLTAIVKPRKVGGRIAFLLVKVYDNDQRHIADSLFTMMARDVE